MPTVHSSFVAVTALLTGSAQGLLTHSQKSTATPSSLPVDPQNFKSLASCSGDQSLSKWSDHQHMTGMLDAWRASSSEAAIVIDNGKSQCLAEGSSSSQKAALSIVEEAEPEICRDNTDHHASAPLRGFRAEKFAVDSEIMKAAGADDRDYITIWPKDGVCTKETPCPVVLFFHGCGGFLPYLQFAMYDDNCMDELKSVMVFPKLRNGKGQGDESWTADGTEVLDKFVMPLWEKFSKENADVIDTDRVMVMGESLGTGMALQAGLSYPDVFSAIVATGLTTGDSCTDVNDFKIDKVLPTKSSRKATKLKTVVATFAENEENADQRITGLFELLKTAGVEDQVSVHFRVWASVGHIESILMTQNQWKSFYDGVWKGSLV